MTDLEITRLCAEAMGMTLLERDGASTTYGQLLQTRWGEQYNPLIQDAQAMALVKRFRLDCTHSIGMNLWAAAVPGNSHSALDADLNRAICECVAKMQAAPTLYT